MSTKLYVGNLAFGTTDADLMELFGLYGPVTSAQVVMDRDSGRSRGFAFVEMGSGADQAIQATNQAEFQGRNLTVNEAKPREDRRSGGGGYAGGNRRY
jgi:RNA recognition motif-containing protein